MRLLLILGEVDAMILCIGDVCTSAILKEVKLSHYGTVVEALVERRGGGVAVQNICGQSGSLAGRGVLQDLYVIDDTVDDLRLGQIDITVVLLLNVDAQVILCVSLVFDV